MLREDKQLYKSYKKNILSLANKSATDPWDYFLGLDLFMRYLKFLRDSYCFDSPHMKKREELFKKIIRKYGEWKNCKNKYIKVIDERTEPNCSYHLSQLRSANYYIVRGIPDGETKDMWIAYKYANIEKTYECYVTEFEKNKQEFFKLLADNIDYIWNRRH